MSALLFLLDTVFFFLIGAVLLRAWMNHLRMPMREQPGLFAMALTDWLVAPVRRVLPRSMAQGRLDWGSLMASLLLALAFGGLWLMLATASQPVQASSTAMLLAIPVVGMQMLLRTALQGVMFLLLAYVVLSWIQPRSPLHSRLDALCGPILRPVRRVVPPLGGVDLSVLLLIVLLQVALMLLR